MQKPTTLFAIIGLGASIGFGAVLARAGTPSQTNDNQSSLKVADLLDKIIQPRFQDAAGQFGLTRMRMFIAGHEDIESPKSEDLAGQFRATDPLQAGLLTRANAEGHDYIIAFLHTLHVPGNPAHMAGEIVPQSTAKATHAYISTHAADPAVSLTAIAVRDAHRQTVYRRMPVGQRVRAADSVSESYGGAERNQTRLTGMQSAATGVLSRLRRGDKVDLKLQDWLVALRPVRALQPSCISCHTGAKQGDTLGVMMYAVNNAVNTADVKVSNN